MLPVRTWKFTLALAAASVLSACVTIHESIPAAAAHRGTALATVALSPDLPLPAFLPEQSAVAPGTRYVLVQAGGASLLLGPLLGSMNIAANTKAMAEQYKDSLLGVDPAAVALPALEKAGIRSGTNSAPAALQVKTFVFVQHCYDDRFRLSLVFHVDGEGQAPAPWVGRYSYHLPTSYPAARFAKLSARELEQYRSELAEGAAALTDLLTRDLAGALPATGKKVNFGSLHLIGNKMGGMGIYTMPQELHFPGAQLVEESASHVTVRVRGNMHATGLFGGMAFGVHRIDRKLVHTLKPV